MSSLKLEFKTETMTYYRPLLRESRSAEETAEAIVPERCPDVSDILFTMGTAVLRGRDIAEGNATVSAGVSATVLLQAQGREEPEILEVYIPFSLRFEHPGLKTGVKSSAFVSLRRLDAHLVNPRKVLVRAAISVTLRVWEKVTEQIPVSTQEKDLELLLRTEPVQILVDAGEKQFTLEDTLPWDPPQGADRLAGSQIMLSHTESRLTGTRAVFKGTAELSLLYQTGEGTLRTDTLELPFSQYIDLEQGQEGDTLRLHSCLSGVDLDLTPEGGMLQVTLQICSQAEVWAKREITYIGDLYACSGQAVPEQETITCESLLDTQLLSAAGRGSLPGDGDSLVAAFCVPGDGSHIRTGELVEFTQPVTVHVLYQNERGFGSGSVRLDTVCANRAAADCKMEAYPGRIQTVVTPGMDGLDIQVTGELLVSTFGSVDLNLLTGAELQEEPPMDNRPGLIIRRTARQETLWDIAKQYRTTTASIRLANGLGEDLPAGTLLLIPGR